jgi:glycerol-3-phosphate acyltransferase PlsY
MNTLLYTVLLALAAFWLAAIPFSVYIGRIFLGKDITDYGDGNPGAANVFRAGGGKLVYLAVLLDIAKGVPFVFLAHSFFGLPHLSIIIIAIFALLGHGFSPLLRWRGGKAVAVTFGVLIAMPEHEMLFAFAAIVILGALLLAVDAWTIILGASGASVYLFLTEASPWEIWLMLCLLAVLIVKHFDELRTAPGINGRLVRWLRR